MSLVRAEIAEQPDAIARTLERNRVAIDGIAAVVRDREPRFVVIASRGSSGNVARYAQHVFGRFCNLVVAFASPSLQTLYDATPRLRDALVLAISQSGESPDVVAVAAEGSRQRCLTIAITNEPSSPLARAARHVIPLCVGPERAVAATKTYTASLAAIADLVGALAGNDDMRRTLRSAPGLVARQLELHPCAAGIVETCSGWRGCAVVGRGPNYATAFETALKLKELTGIPAEAFAPADLLHGPIAVVDQGYPVVTISPGGPARHAMDELLEAIRHRGGRSLILTDRADLASADELVLPLVSAADWLTPFVSTVAAQLLAVDIAERRGLELDRPFGLSKVTHTY